MPENRPKSAREREEQAVSREYTRVLQHAEALEAASIVRDLEQINRDYNGGIFPELDNGGSAVQKLVERSRDVVVDLGNGKRVR